MKIRLCSAALALSACSLASAVLAEPDVGVFSTSDAEAMLADGETAQDCEIKLDDGTCPQVSKTRGFSFARPKSESSEVSSSSAGKTSYAKSTSSNDKASYVKPLKSFAKPSKQSKVKQGQMAVNKTPSPSLAKPAAREVPLQFEAGSSALSPQSMENLRNLAVVLNSDEHKSKRIMIVGHTDKSGILEENQKLSYERADTAARYLYSVGVDWRRVLVRGRGFLDNLPGLSPYDPRNRRIEVQRVE
ncbi:MAG: OmpA family protein [Novosphingobium sp.]|nr:OmpA family protein [Novosphingobium sp.]